MKNIIIILLTLSFLFSARGDLISIEQISTRTLGNNQIYIDNELSSTTTDQFSLEPVQYGESDLLKAMKMIAKSGQGPKDQLPSMGCNIKWFKN